MPRVCSNTTQAVATTQVAAVASAAFNLMAFAQTAAPSAAREKRTPAWECGVEELRTRISIRDLQTPAKKDEANAKLRIQLAPQYVELSAYGTLPDGSPIVQFVVPRAAEEQARNKLLADVAAGVHDQALLKAAQACKVSAEKKKANAAKKVPQDSAAAEAAIAALENGALVPATVVAEGEDLAQQFEVAATPVAAAAQAVGTPFQMPAGVSLPSL